MLMASKGLCSALPGCCSWREGLWVRRPFLGVPVSLRLGGQWQRGEGGWKAGGGGSAQPHGAVATQSPSPTLVLSWWRAGSGTPPLVV